MEQRSLRLGAVVIAGAVLLRLAGSGAFQPVAQALSQPEVASFLMYLETGRVIRTAPADSPAETVALTIPAETTVPETIPETLPEQVPLSLPENAAELVEIRSYCGYQVDIPALLAQPLCWDLTGEAPTVLILHTHTTESYTKTTETYEETSAYRTLDENYNMLSIGDYVAELLEAAGIGVVHDRQLHDYPSYNGSYSDSREAAESYLQQYPSICLVLDLHRDAAEDSNGNQVASTITVDGEATAQLMLVMGSDASGLSHANWQENMALAVKLQAVLEQQAPGICRSISFRSQRFNQDLSPGALLVEVGSAGNTRAEAMNAARVLAQAIILLAKGTA